MDDYQSLSHTKWECKYHVVFIPNPDLHLRAHDRLVAHAPGDPAAHGGGAGPGRDRTRRRSRLAGEQRTIAKKRPRVTNSRSRFAFASRDEPGRVFDPVVGLDEVPEGYRAMNEREAIKVMVKP